MINLLKSLSIIFGILPACVNGIKSLIIKYKIYKLNKRKKEIQDAQSPSDWTDLLNK